MLRVSKYLKNQNLNIRILKLVLLVFNPDVFKSLFGCRDFRHIGVDLMVFPPNMAMADNFGCDRIFDAFRQIHGKCEYRLCDG